MAKKICFPCVSLGSEAEDPDISDLVSFVSAHKGDEVDLVSYLIEASVRPQVAAKPDMPCAAGLFYARRLMELTSGEEYDLFSLDIGDIEYTVSLDAELASGLFKGCRFALPAPHMFQNVKLYSDRDDSLFELYQIYRRIMRSMRDKNVSGHVLHGNGMPYQELEELLSPKVLVMEWSDNPVDIEKLLCFQSQMVVRRSQLAPVLELMDSYDVNQLILLDPDEEMVGKVLEHFDPDQIMTAGYAKSNPDTYWKELTGFSYSVI